MCSLRQIVFRPGKNVVENLFNYSRCYLVSSWLPPVVPELDFVSSVTEGFPTLSPNRKCGFVAITLHAKAQRGETAVGDQNAISVARFVTSGRVARTRPLLLLPPVVLLELVTAEKKKEKKSWDSC